MKRKYYLILDTETATVPFANTIARNEHEKKNIAIAKPLVYDIGWVISDRQGNIIKKENYLVQETFFVPQIFNTAYYRDKRPQYMEMFGKREIEALPWNNIIEILLQDCRNVDFVCAYNATFDFKKAIPFTEKYIKALYSNYYQKWEDRQIESCKQIVNGCNNAKNEKYLEPIFELRNEEFPIVDLWGLACQRLINNRRYKDYCLKNGLLTQSGLYFKSSAETSFQYLAREYNFVESHTALDDALIETKILAKALQKGKVFPMIDAFPFRALGFTYDYVNENPKYKQVVIDKINTYLSETKTANASYCNRLLNIIGMLKTE